MSNAVNQMAFVSLRPGTLDGGSAVFLRVHRTGAVVSAALRDGGLDPVGVPAVAGDTISLTFITPPEPPFRSFTVPLQTPPALIRTEPAPSSLDVALNARLRVVFSEPIHPVSLTSQDFDLRSGGTVIGVQFSFANPEHTVVELTPAANLAAGTEHELAVRPGIRDLDGAPLEAATNVSFTTAPIIAAQLAFVRDSQIYVVNADGGLVQLTHSGDGVSNRDPAWSPDGKRLAFSRSYRNGNSDIYVMNADGSNVLRRTNGGSNWEPAWSPDGRTIAFTGYGGGTTGVLLIDADGGSGSRVLLNRPGYNANPAWSPDGRKITFTSDWRAYDFLYDLYIMNADGSGIEPLLEGPFFWVDGLIFYFQSAWSPDGQKIAVVVCGWGDNCSQSEIAVVNADGSGLKVLAQAGGFARPTWSPDGRTIAFSSSRCRACPSSIRFVSADGGAEGVIVTNGHSPAWRPIGQSVAVFATDGSGNSVPRWLASGDFAGPRSVSLGVR